MVARQPRQHQPVGGQADDGDDEHLDGPDLRRGEEAQPSLAADEERNHKQREAVEERGEDLGAVQTVGAGLGGHAAGQAQGKEAEGQGEDIGKDMHGIGQQRQAATDPGANDLHNQNRDGDGCGEAEPPGLIGVRRAQFHTMIVSHRLPGVSLSERSLTAT